MYIVEPDTTKIEGHYKISGPGMATESSRERSIRLYPDPDPMPNGLCRQGAILRMLLNIAYEAGKKARSAEIMQLLKG